MEPGRCHLQTLAKSIQTPDRELQAKSEAMSSHVLVFILEQINLGSSRED